MPSPAPNIAATTTEPLVWVLKTSSRGDTNNRLAMAKAIAPNNHVLVDGKSSGYTAEGMAKHFTGAYSLDAIKTWPDIFLVCEQETSKYGREIKALSGGQTFVVGVQTPDIDTNDFDENVGAYSDYDTDMQVVWSHLPTAQPGSKARNHGINRFFASAVPSPLTPTLLEAELQELPLALERLRGKRPIYAVAMGSLISIEERFGHSNWTEFAADKKLMEANLDRLLEQVANAAKRDGGAVVITTSHRSPHQFATRVTERLGDIPHVFYDWAKERGRKNPYRAMMALADRIVVTADSLSMTADALATGKPVFSFLAYETREKGTEVSLADRLKNTAMVKPEIRDYLLGQAEDQRLFGMEQLGTRRLRTKPPVNGAQVIGDAIQEAHHAFKLDKAKGVDAQPMRPAAKRNLTR